MVDRFLPFDDLRVVFLTEAMWVNHQDVVAVVKREIDPIWPHDVHT